MRENTTAQTEPITAEGLIGRGVQMRAMTFADAKGLLREGFEAGLSKSELRYVCARLARRLDVKPSVLQTILEEQLTRAHDGTLLPDQSAVAAWIIPQMKDVFMVVVILEGLVWQYDRTKDSLTFGCHVSEAIEELDDKIVALLPRHPLLKTQGARKETIKRVVNQLKNPDYFNGARIGPSLPGGHLVLDPETGEVALLEHSVEHKARGRVRVNYDPAARAPLFLAGLERSISDPAARLALSEFVGAVIFGLTPTQDASRRIFLAYGPPGSGKSTFLNLLKVFFPAELVGNVPPATWVRAEGRARLAGLALNLCTEVGSGKLNETEHFKQIASCETVTARFLFKMEHEITPVAYHMWASNRLPSLDDASGAMERRLRLIHFDGRLEQFDMDDDYLSRLTKELPGILNWGIEGAQRLIRQKRFTEPAAEPKALLGMRFGSDVAALFMHTCTEGAQGAVLLTAETRRAYLAFLEELGLDVAPSFDGFMRRLSGLMAEEFGAVRRATNNGPRYEGVRLKAPAVGTGGQAPTLDEI